jgi:hypothetical protein
VKPLRPLVLAIAALAAGCATAPQAPREGVATRLTLFSASVPGGAVPSEWTSWALSRFRPFSQYQLVEDGGATVLKGSARASEASGLLHFIDLDPRERPIISWRWKVMDLAPSDGSPDDSPVRIMVNFDGDYSKIAFSDRVFYDEFRLFTGQLLPYAGVMYVWGSRTPRGEVAPNKYTSRIRIIAVESGRENLGTWRMETRNVLEDYRRLFGEEPGRIVSVGLMTEADGSDRALEAYYGDIAFREREEAAAAALDERAGSGRLLPVLLQPAFDQGDGLIEHFRAHAFLRRDGLHQQVDALDVGRAIGERARRRRRTAERERRVGVLLERHEVALLRAQ